MQTDQLFMSNSNECFGNEHSMPDAVWWLPDIKLVTALAVSQCFFKQNLSRLHGPCGSSRCKYRQRYSSHRAVLWHWTLQTELPTVTLTAARQNLGETDKREEKIRWWISETFAQLIEYTVHGDKLRNDPRLLEIYLKVSQTFDDDGHL